VFNFPGYKINLNKNYIMISSHPSKNGHLQEQKQQAGKDVVKQEPSYTVDGMQISTTIMQSSMNIPQKAKDGSSVIPLLGIYPKEPKSGYNRDICTPIFIAALLTTVKPYSW
jgi:hypothetical protein